LKYLKVTLGRKWFAAIINVLKKLSAAVASSVAAIAGTVATLGAGAVITGPVVAGAIAPLLTALKTNIMLGLEMIG
jgi:hypothetical protein